MATPITVGDVVLVHEEGLPRSFWKLAKVEEVITGRDGQPRGAVLRVPAKNGQTTTLRRPLQLLYPLEGRRRCDEVEDTSENTEKDHQEPQEQEQPSLRRPKRQAAAQAQDWIAACLTELT